MTLNNARSFVIAMTVGCVLGIAAMTFFILQPVLRDTNTLAGQVLTAQSELQAQYDNRRQLLATTARIKTAADAIAQLSKQFVPSGDELSFITTIEDLSDHDKVVSKLSLSEGGLTAGGKEFDRGFSITLDGSFRSVMRALVDIERMPQLTSIANASLRGSPGTLGQDAPVSMVLSGFFASPPSGI